MNLKSILATGALVAALVVPAVAGAQTVVRRYPHRTVIVHHAHHPYHRRVVVVRHPVYHRHRTVIVKPHRTVIVHH